MHLECRRYERSCAFQEIYLRTTHTHATRVPVPHTLSHCERASAAVEVGQCAPELWGESVTLSVAPHMVGVVFDRALRSTACFAMRFSGKVIDCCFHQISTPHTIRHPAVRGRRGTMSSSGMRGIRRKKSSMAEVKIAVVGAPSVGKSALVVRFLTKRYIGEYDHQSEQRYRSEVIVDGEPVLFEVLDTCNKVGARHVQQGGCWTRATRWVLDTCNKVGAGHVQQGIAIPSLVIAIPSLVIAIPSLVIAILSLVIAIPSLVIAIPSLVIGKLISPNDDSLPASEVVSWADGLLLVYSITDRQSFDWVKRCRHSFSELGSWPPRLSGSCSPNLSPSPPPLDGSPSSSPPTLLVGNKADMVHLRQVSSEEGEILAKDMECQFCEVAASDQVAQVASAFHDLYREVQCCRKRCKTSLLDRVLGANKSSRSYGLHLLLVYPETRVVKALKGSPAGNASRHKWWRRWKNVTLETQVVEALEGCHAGDTSSGGAGRMSRWRHKWWRRWKDLTLETRVVEALEGCHAGDTSSGDAGRKPHWRHT
ncbi:Small GTPase superfamily [Trinorchestia longiramus]|nr:Small GTPase superfamily [Trinorchestia longiramus]